MVKIICFGDSLTFGYQVSREDKWHVIATTKTGISLVNRGVSGDTTVGMLKRIQKQVFDAKPDGMILMAGYNDIFFNRSWEQAAKNLAAMVDQSRAKGIQVFVAIPPPIHLPVTFKEGGELVDFEKAAVMIADYCQWLRDYTTSSQLFTLDFSAAGDWCDNDLYLDGIHQSPAGHRLMADQVIDFLEKTVIAK
ncbi:GDSL-type esterase/lipase family protein [Acetobacterium wieringae]|nr:GDSL-type esterase/lipase family protein [Acetobacterium wieringae]UYO64177.1 GDSL-type esterase/lipase family protein [Acetobacterium wieringae]